MKEIPKLFKRFGVQILYFLGIPAFFISFVLLYHPFDIDTLLDINAGRFPFNITMIFCIIMVVMIISRTSFYALRNTMRINWGWYIFWCLMEIVVISHFVALYIWLIFNHTLFFFDILVTTIGYAAAILIFPYVILALAIELSARSETGLEADENNRIRFYDDKQNLKFVATASSILYIEAEENYVRIYYTDGDKIKNYLLRNTMKSIEELCHYNGLVRCHRSFYINSSRIKILRKDKEGIIYAELDNKEVKRIPVTKRYYDQLSTLL